MTEQAHRWLLGALAALAAACPAVATAAPVTGPQAGATPTTALVTATGTTSAARVAYGLTTGYGLTAPAAATGDEFVLTGLTPGATYHYRAEIPAGDGSWVPGADGTLTTSPAGAPELVGRPSAAASGDGMTCDPGNWTAPSNVVAVTWWQGATPVLGAMSTFGFVPPAAGDYACRVTARGPSVSSYWTSRPAHFTPPPTPPRATTQPAIFGDASAKEGSILNCDRGQWSGASTVSQQWQRDGGSIPGATAVQYKVTSADLGHSLICQVTATGPGGSTVIATSPFAVPPAPAPPVTTTPLPIARPAVNAGGSSTPPIVLVTPLDGGGSSGLDSDTRDSTVSASAALKTLLTGRLPTRRALLRPDGARLRFRAPAPLGMLRVKLVSADNGRLLGVGARWYDESRTGVVRLRLTRAGRKALRSGTLVSVTLVATFVPDHGRSETESRGIDLAP